MATTTYTRYINVMQALEDRLAAMVDTYSNKIFEKVEWGRRGTVDNDSAGAWILPHPDSDVPLEREFQKSWRQWNFQIFIMYMGEDERETLDKIVFLMYEVYDLLMEVDDPPEGKGYNRTLNNLVRTLEIEKMHIVGMEDRGFKQVALINLWVNLRI